MLFIRQSEFSKYSLTKEPSSSTRHSFVLLRQIQPHTVLQNGAATVQVLIPVQIPVHLLQEHPINVTLHLRDAHGAVH